MHRLSVLVPLAAATVSSGLLLAGCGDPAIINVGKRLETDDGQPRVGTAVVLTQGSSAPRPADDGAEHAAQDDCGDVDRLGECDGAVARWCVEGRLEEEDCAEQGQSCRWGGDDLGVVCAADRGQPLPSQPEPPPPPEPEEEPGTGPVDPCGGLDFLGQCVGDIARWCDAGQIRQEDCQQRGLRCDYVNDSLGYYCTDGTAPQIGSPPPPADGEGCSAEVVQEQLSLTNQARQQAGLSALVCHESLTRSAYLHSLDMCHAGRLSHTSSDGRSLSDRLEEQHVTYRTAGENVAFGQTSAAEVHQSWMNSPGHRANILNGSFGRIGIGYVDCGGRPYWTQNFAD